MREIKARYWNERWKRLEGSGYILDSDGLHTTKYVIPQLFTGLRDKNGVEIYEGDIVRVFYEGRPAVGKVIYTCDRFIVTIPEDTKKPYFLCLYSFNRIPLFKWSESEVIGNIYENKELLNA